MNETKTEITTIEKKTDDWKNVRKLGNLINENEDIKRRKILATSAFNKLSTVWQRNHIINEGKRIRLYEALILPIILYNCGTWGLTKKNLDSLDSFHRKQMRRVLGIHWPEKISNEDLYTRCRVRTISSRVKEQRWRLFGHILRRDETLPAQTSMKDYFRSGEKYRGRTPASLPTTLNQDLQLYSKYIETTPEEDISQKQKDTHVPTSITTNRDLEELRTLAQDRDVWRDVFKWIHRVK